MSLRDKNKKRRGDNKVAIKEYLIQNWSLVLLLAAFSISLKTTVFLDKRTVRRILILNIAVFLLSIVVFAEFYVVGNAAYRTLRTVLMAIRYSSTPFIIAQILFALVKKQRWFVFIPAIILTGIDVSSIWNGVVFRVLEDGNFKRGPLGLLPFIVAGLYCAWLILTLLRQSNQTAAEIIPIVFFCVIFLSGLLFPFLLGADYSQLFCMTIAIALFVYYVFSILQLTKKDALTGLLNRQAYYSDVATDPEDISAIVSLDMNGLKTVNDKQGHDAGDEALSTLALCIWRSLKRRQSGYRVGGDEFVIVCRKTTHLEVDQLVERIRKYVGETDYTCSIGYSYRIGDKKDVETLLKESDTVMYEEKAAFYKAGGQDRRKK